MSVEKDIRSDFDRKVREVAEMRMDIFVSQVRKLNELREEGLITDEEFSTKKAQLLAQL